MNPYMKLAKELAQKGVMLEEGGPFGAVITDKEGNVIATGNNQVLMQNDPTAHAEITAIRNACKKLHTYDLSDYILYTSCEPCPMCLSAIIWSNISKVFYACTKEDAATIGFRDDFIYSYLRGEKEDVIHLEALDREECIDLFEDYKNQGKPIY